MTVLAAAALAENESDPEAAKSKHRAVSKAIAKVADTLGNTPAVSRSSYVLTYVWSTALRKAKLLPRRLVTGPTR